MCSKLLFVFPLCTFTLAEEILIWRLTKPLVGQYVFYLRCLNQPIQYEWVSCRRACVGFPAGRSEGMLNWAEGCGVKLPRSGKGNGGRTTKESGYISVKVIVMWTEAVRRIHPFHRFFECFLVDLFIKNTLSVIAQKLHSSALHQLSHSQSHHLPKSLMFSYLWYLSLIQFCPHPINLWFGFHQGIVNFLQ